MAREKTDSFYVVDKNGTEILINMFTRINKITTHSGTHVGTGAIEFELEDGTPINKNSNDLFQNVYSDEIYKKI